MTADRALIDRLRDSIASGGALCLLGAGFSVAGTDQRGLQVPGVQDLIGELKNAVGLDPEEDASLTDVAEYCEDSAKLKHDLSLVLLNRLTFCIPTAHQKTVVRQPWRSIFTTNFDDTTERCLDEHTYQPVTPTSLPVLRSQDKTYIYYMHGRARDLLEKNGDPRIVISERNYIRLHEDNRRLYAELKNELFAAKLIVIVGYSIRDLDVARVFLESGHAFRPKTIIICAEDEKPLALSRLNKFGDVLPIGLEGLAAILQNPASHVTTGTESLQFVDEVIAPPSKASIEGEDFVRLILTGAFDRAAYLSQLQQETSGKAPYLVSRRSARDTIINRPAGGLNRFIVSSDFGNGKTIFLEQLSIDLLASGYRVYRISSSMVEAFSDIDRILKSPEQTAFLIDDVIRYQDVAKYVATRLNSFSILVCTTRGDPEESSYKSLAKDLGGAAKHIDLNHLSHAELEEWDTALERWGLWEKRIALPRAERIKFLSGDCASENRSIVLALFRTSRIADRINQIVDFFLHRGRYQKAFAALLISSLCQKHVTWESIVSWIDIDEQALRRDIGHADISQLFFDGREWNVFTSAQLAEYILRTKYVESDKDTLLEVYSRIIIETAESAGAGYLGATYRENLKELMKFRFLTRLFGDDHSALALIGRVYRRLSEARYIRDNPQFWLQYAMSRMEVADLRSAETFLNTALGLADGRGKDYSPYQILDQRARLYFRKNSSQAGRFSLTEIRQAIKDLRDVLDEPNREIIYLYRSVPLIQAFVELQIDHCGEDIRAEIREFLEKVAHQGKTFSHLPRSKKGETKVLQKSLDDAILTLRFA